MNLQSHVGKIRGSFKNKDNRTAKLLENWEIIRKLMEHLITQGNGNTLRARCAYGVLLMMETGIRIGNEESASGYICGQKHHASFGKTINVYGLTTLRKQHAYISVSGKLVLNFLGKKAVEQNLRTSNNILLQYFHAVSRHNLPTWLGITYSDIYKFVKKSIGKKYKPKDIRTAAVNILFLHKIQASKILQTSFQRKSDANKALKLVVQATANEIGHTAGVCKSAYLSKSLQSVIKETLIEKAKKARQLAKARR